MKSIIDIVKEMDGATPSNTLGMGNPTPPTEGELGSEPICQNCKKDKKKKKVKESLLDVDDYNIDDAIIINWIKENLAINWRDGFEKHFEIIDGTINCHTLFRLNIHKPIPNYIKFGDLYELNILVSYKSKDIVIPLPTSCEHVEIWPYTQREILFVQPNDSHISDMKIGSDMEKITIPKKVKVDYLDLEDCLSLKQLKLGECTICDLPGRFVRPIIESAINKLTGGNVRCVKCNGIELS